jgi:tRNA dimethylallyltransferase
LDSKLPLLVIVLGPTAVGKSGLAVQLARRFGGEIINGDSMQVYRGFSIGTDKPSLEEQAGIPHHLLDLVDPRSQFCAMDFVRETRRVLDELRPRGVLPIIAGGTGLYLKALLDGLFPGPGRDPEVRQRLGAEAAAQGLESLRLKLEAVDPDYARTIGRNDRLRIIRALEVFEVSGIPLSRHFHHTSGFVQDFYCLRIGLKLDRQEMTKRIEARVDRMFERGLVAEVEALLGMGLPEDAPPFRALGYKRVLLALHHRISLEEALALTKQDTRQYAKRQMTWFRKMAGVRWFSPFDFELVAALVEANL